MDKPCKYEEIRNNDNGICHKHKGQYFGDACDHDCVDYEPKED